MPQSKNQTILIFGAGEMGTCLGRILEKNQSVFYWDKNEAKRTPHKTLEQMIFESSFIFLTVPSNVLTDVLNQLKLVLPESIPLICFAKGISETGQTVPEIIAKYLSNPIMLIAGPMIAEEINIGQAGFGIAAGPENIYQTLNNFFSETVVRLKHETDIQSVAFCSALKNTYAVFIGLIDGLGYGNNVCGYFASLIWREWKEVAELLGIKPEIMFGPAGVGDFIATAFSAYSKNRQVGQELAQKIIVGESEGIRTLRGINYLLGKKQIKKLPILYSLSRIVIENQDPADTVQYLIKA